MDGLVEGSYTQAAYKAQQRAVLLYAAFLLQDCIREGIRHEESG